MGVFGNGTKIGAQRRRADSWMEYAEDLEKKYKRLSDKHVKLQNEHNKMSNEYAEINGLVGVLNRGASVKAIASIHILKKQQLQFKADEEFWGVEKRREANIKLMAEAEYDYHVLADPSYRLNSASKALYKIAENSGDMEAEKIKAIARKMTNTGGIREDAHRADFLAKRIQELRDNVRYVNDWGVEPIYDSIPSPMMRDKVRESNPDWKIVKNDEKFKTYLIQDQRM